jgi:hypothetical protein
MSDLASRVVDRILNPPEPYASEPLDDLFQLTRYLDGGGPRCTMVLLGYTSTILSEEARGRIRLSTVIQEEWGELRTAGIRWISAPRPLDDMRSLCAQTCGCSQKIRNGSSHTSGDVVLRQLSDPRGPFLAFLEHLARILALPYGGQAPGSVNLDKPIVRLNRIDRRTAWPRTLADLLPHGPEGTIRGILRWLKCDVGLEVTLRLQRLLLDTLAFTAALTLPFVVTSRVLVPLGLVAPLQALTRMVEALPDTTPLEDMPIFQVNTCVGFATNLCIIFTDARARRALTEPYADDLMSALVHFLAAFNRLTHKTTAHKDLSVYSCVNGLVGCVRLLLDDFPRLRSYPAKFRAIHALVSKAPRISLWQRFHQVVFQLNRSQQCASPECARTFADTGPFRRCERCRRVVYCSRGCQKTAWRHAVAPHRDVCEPLRLTCIAYDLDSGSLPLKAEPDNFQQDLPRLIVEHKATQTQYEQGVLREWTDLHHITKRTLMSSVLSGVSENGGRVGGGGRAEKGPGGYLNAFYSLYLRANPPVRIRRRR